MEMIWMRNLSRIKERLRSMPDPDVVVIWAVAAEIVSAMTQTPNFSAMISLLSN
jgi:hypothetical protein